MATKEKQLPAGVTSGMTLQPVFEARTAKQAVEALQGMVKDLLTEKIDYGVIPGTGQKKTLLKPGAEKLCTVYGFSPDVEITKETEDWDKEPPLFDYTIKTILRDQEGRVRGVGLGSCNSWESKYKYRNASRVCPDCGVDALCRSKYEDKNTGDKGWYCFDKKGGCGAKFRSDAPEIANQEVGKIDNPDIADQKNTVLKMAKKRSYVDATIQATMSGELFTQDVEDFKSFNVEVIDAEEVDEEKKPSTTSTSSTKQTSPSTSSSTAKTSTQSATTGQKPPATTADKTPGQTGSATQVNEKKPSAATGTSTSNAGSGTTSSAGALSAEIEDAIHAAVTYMTQNQEAITAPPRESAQMLLKLFKLRAGNDETAKTQFNAYLDEKHNVNRDNPGNYTWEVFNQTIIDFKGA